MTDVQVPLWILNVYCRGTETSRYQSSQVNNDALSVDAAPFLGPLHIETSPFPDELISWASEPGHVSWREPETGTWYIYNLVKVWREKISFTSYYMNCLQALQDHHEDHHLLEILEITRERVEKLSTKDGEGQRPTYMSGLTEEIWFRESPSSD